MTNDNSGAPQMRAGATLIELTCARCGFRQSVFECIAVPGALVCGVCRATLRETPQHPACDACGVADGLVQKFLVNLQSIDWVSEGEYRISCHADTCPDGADCDEQWQAIRRKYGCETEPALTLDEIAENVRKLAPPVKHSGFRAWLPECGLCGGASKLRRNLSTAEGAPPWVCDDCAEKVCRYPVEPPDNTHVISEEPAVDPYAAQRERELRMKIDKARSELDRKMPGPALLPHRLAVQTDWSEV